MATTTATFQPGFATAGNSASSNTSLATTTAGQLTNNSGNAMTSTGSLSTVSGPLANVQELLQQPGVKKAMPLILIALAVLLFGISYVWINTPAYRPLSISMSDADQQTAFETLKASEFKPVVDTSTGQITVPANKYHEARIFLASKGIPKNGAMGIESLKDQSAMTTSQFMEQVRYVAAMEQEIAKTITQIDSIQTARVHLAMPKLSSSEIERHLKHLWW